MRNERSRVIAGMVILALMIAAVLIVALRYMREEPWWNREPAPAVTDAPEAGKSPWLEVQTENLPPG